MHIASFVLTTSTNIAEDTVFHMNMTEHNRVTVRHKEEGVIVSNKTYTVAEWREWLDTLCYMLTVDRQPFLTIQWQIGGLPTIEQTIADLKNEDMWTPVERALEFALLCAVKEYAPSFQCGACPDMCPPAAFPAVASACCDGMVPDRDAHPKEHADAVSERSSDSEEFEERPSFFAEKRYLSPNLKAFLGLPKDAQLSRCELTRAMWTYCKTHALNDKQTIHADAPLRTLLGLSATDTLTIFNLQRYLAPHISTVPLEEESESESDYDDMPPLIDLTGDSDSESSESSADSEESETVKQLRDLLQVKSRREWGGEDVDRADRKSVV